MSCWVKSLCNLSQDCFDIGGDERYEKQIKKNPFWITVN